jgi:hypothetical protein
MNQLLDIAGPQSFLPAQREEVRASIDALESAMLRGIDDGSLEKVLHEGGTDEGNAECSHYFGTGVYVRSLWIKAGSVVVGRLHKQARVCMILAGRCRFVDEFQARVVEAPWIGEFEAGCKTAVYAEQDTLWAACLGTDIKDPQEAFYSLTAANHQELLEYQS